MSISSPTAGSLLPSFPEPAKSAGTCFPGSAKIQNESWRSYRNTARQTKWLGASRSALSLAYCQKTTSLRSSWFAPSLSFESINLPELRLQSASPCCPVGLPPYRSTWAHSCSTSQASPTEYAGCTRSPSCLGPTWRTPPFLEAC